MDFQTRAIYAPWTVTDERVTVSKRWRLYSVNAGGGGGKGGSNFAQEQAYMQQAEAAKLQQEAQAESLRLQQENLDRQEAQLAEQKAEADARDKAAADAKKKQDEAQKAREDRAAQSILAGSTAASATELEENKITKKSYLGAS